MPFCDSLHELAKMTWNHLAYQYQQGYRAPDERAFTDHHMVELSIRHGPAVRAKLFSVSEEANTGADFEMWFRSGDELVAALVQAKKLNNAGVYEGLDRTIGSGPNPRRQIDVLIDVCTNGLGPQRRFLGHAPLFLFYNGPPSTMPQDLCCDGTIPEIQRGCTFARAQDVKDTLDQFPSPPTHKTIGDIGPVAFPWRCLFCCHRFAGARSSLVNRLGRFATGSFALESVFPFAPGGEDAPTIRSHGEIPRYVRLIADEQPFDAAAWPEDEDAPGARRVVVMTEPEEVGVSSSRD